MGAISIVLLVAFVIVCVLSILLVLVQDQDNSGMGGMFGGGNSAAFGSHSASVLTKTTGVLVALFFVTAFALAFINRKTSSSDDLSEAARSMNIQADGTEGSAADWFEKKEEPATPATIEETPSADGADTASGENSESVSENGAQEQNSASLLSNIVGAAKTSATESAETVANTVGEDAAKAEYVGTGYNPEGPSGVEGANPPVYSDMTIGNTDGNAASGN